MRLLLSADDLIALFERKEPIPPERFQSWLRDRQGCLVLTGTNVVEASVALLEAGRRTALQHLLQAIAEVSVCCLKEMAIFVEELGGAVVAFARGKEPLQVDPYVAKWSDTLGISLGKSYASQGTFETVTHLWRTAPEALRHFHRYQEILAEEMTVESSASEADVAIAEPSLQQFERYAERQLKLHGFSLPASRRSAFANWVYANPQRCPGLRLSFEVNQLLPQPTASHAAEADLRGLGHIHAIPYVDAITLGPPLFESCRSVSSLLQQQNPALPYTSRIHPHLQSVLRQWP